MSDEWIDALAKQLPAVRPSFIDEVRKMSREELQRRLLIGADWNGRFFSCLDGIPEIFGIPGAGIDGCRTHKEVRAIVTTLVRECPKTWEDSYFGRMKDVKADDASGNQAEGIAP